VFVAGGTIPTTRILLRSLEAYDQTVWLKDSQYFLLPLLLLNRVRGATHESLHALSQIFLELFSADGTENGTHIQIYSNNDLISQAVAQAFGPLKQPLGFLLRNLQERMLVAQGFLHSEQSSRVAIRLKKNPGEGSDQLELKAELNSAARARVRGVVWKLLRQTRNLGAAPLPMMLKFAEPGRSFHCGGTFPMNEQPKGFQTDLLGRLPGWKRVHAVDATVFPSIPATTITLSVMANAHRIGWEAAKLE
jgi:choline dehydrogenase-like flavoprotein